MNIDQSDTPNEDELIRVRRALCGTPDVDMLSLHWLENEIRRIRKQLENQKPLCSQGHTI